MGAAAGPVACAAGRNATVGSITEGAMPVAGAARRSGIVWPVASTAGLVADAAGPITEDAEPLDGVRNNASKRPQHGQQVPLQGHSIGFTILRMAS